MELITLLIAILTLTAAVVFGIINWVDNRKEHAARVKPHVHCEDVIYSGTPNCVLTLGNAGGACCHGFVALWEGATVLVNEDFQLPQGARDMLVITSPPDFLDRPIPLSPNYNSYTLLFIFQDLDGKWWDFEKHIEVPLKQKPPGLPTQPAFRQWAKLRLHERIEEIQEREKAALAEHAAGV